MENVKLAAGCRLNPQAGRRRACAALWRAAKAESLRYTVARPSWLRVDGASQLHVPRWNFQTGA